MTEYLTAPQAAELAGVVLEIIGFRGVVGTVAAGKAEQARLAVRLVLGLARIAERQVVDLRVGSELVDQGQQLSFRRTGRQVVVECLDAHFFRGTPLFVQILLMHFAVMPLFIHPVNGWLISGDLARTLKQDHGALISGVVALTLNSAAYISEVFRAGIQSIAIGPVC